MPDSDASADLLGRVAEGDAAAMRMLYDSIGPDLYRFIQTKVGDASEAADVLQETMLDVWRQAGAYEGRARVRTWIFGIARNKAIDRWRNLKAPIGGELDETIPDEAPDAERVMAALQDGAALRACVAGLSKAQRTAVELAYFQDLSYGEIAVIENCAVGTVKTRVHYAKLLLQRCLTKVDGRDGAG